MVKENEALQSIDYRPLARKAPGQIYGQVNRALRRAKFGRQERQEVATGVREFVSALRTEAKKRRLITENERRAQHFFIGLQGSLFALGLVFLRQIVAFPDSEFAVMINNYILMTKNILPGTEGELIDGCMGLAIAMTTVIPTLGALKIESQIAGRAQAGFGELLVEKMESLNKLLGQFHLPVAFYCELAPLEARCSTMVVKSFTTDVYFPETTIINDSLFCGETVFSNFASKF